RISPDGAGESLGEHQLLCHTTQNHSGSHHHHRVLRFHHVLPRREAPVESLRRICLRARCGGICLFAEKLNDNSLSRQPAAITLAGSILANPSPFLFVRQSCAANLNSPPYELLRQAEI